MNHGCSFRSLILSNDYYLFFVNCGGLLSKPMWQDLDERNLKVHD